MRVVSGKFRGLHLAAVPGMSTRPTTDKVKESLFNMIGPYFEGGVALDLFGGSGGLAIEAVSRGMDAAIIVDRAYPAIKTIRQNIKKTHSDNQFAVIKQEANHALKLMQKHDDHFKLVFLDPPYAKQQIVDNIKSMVALGLLQPGAIIAAETNQEANLPVDLDGFEFVKRQTYGITVLTIYRYKGDN